ncbi:MAG: FAD-dependent oxidoreductase, partial [Pseudomonadota bacterium]
MPQRVAVIGAGIAGLSCARTLRRAGCYVDLFEASNGVGGRMATTRLGLTAFDHGAQYVTAREGAFRDYIDEISTYGYVQKWEPSIAGPDDEPQSPIQDWFVGTPGMSAMVRPLAESVQVFT